MHTYPVMQVDAFTRRPLGGNPCAVIFDADDLDEALMLAIAREMNLSETAFMRASQRADFGARYFTPAEEIPLAGHPTLAVVHALIESGQLALSGETTRITLELKAGVIPVDITTQAQVQRIVMSQIKPQFLACYPAQQVAPAFGLSPADFLPEVPIQTVSTGTPQLMLPVRELEALRKIAIQPGAFQRLREAGDFFSAHLFCLGGVTAEGDTFARHFALPPDVIEDPFTGSATGGMAAYLWRYGLLPSPTFTAEQGHWLGRPGSASVEVIGPPEDIQTVKVGGSAVTVLRGSLTI
ncbi:MAG: PhzF family phenazine biosynthesis protein [Anaerolineales bacterium]|nr:PhzF family phenazine biosynthesis protein [Anaerolineales bacterium]